MWVCFTWKKDVLVYISIYLDVSTCYFSQLILYIIGVKLASIFAKNVQGKEVSEPTDEVKPLSEQEKTALIVKRSFLLSGLPVNIQQQQKAQHMYQLGDFPPLPEISHVLQVPKELSVGSMWKLPNVSLPLKVEDNSNEVEQMCTNRINILNKYSIKNTASAFDQVRNFNCMI